MKDRPPISEKVKFWEEQDKINKALIPRFFEMHNSVKDLNEHQSELNEKYLELLNKIDSQNSKNVISNNSKLFIYIGVFVSIMLGIISLIISLQ